MKDIKPLPTPIKKMLEAYGINPDELQLAVKSAYEEIKRKDDKNDL